MSFHVGQKVMCINDIFVSEGWELVEHKPRRGRIYTVRETLLFDFEKHPQCPALLLCEIVNPVCWFCLNSKYWEAETPFWDERFRPIIKRNTDISIFTEILAGASKQAESVG